MTEVLRVFAGLDVKAVQVAYEVVRVTFASPEHFRAAKSFSEKHLFGLWCSILGDGPPITRVHVFDFPFEEDDRSLEVAFETYGTVKSVKKKTFLSKQNILNGTRLVDVALSGVLPRFLMVDEYLCRLWYRGQPLVCNLCAVQGHRSANCPNKDKCRKYGKTGHFARPVAHLTGQRETLRIFRPWARLHKAPVTTTGIRTCTRNLSQLHEIT